MNTFFFVFKYPLSSTSCFSIYLVVSVSPPPFCRFGALFPACQSVYSRCSKETHHHGFPQFISPFCFHPPHTLSSYRLCVFYIVLCGCRVWFGSTVIANWSRYQIEVKIHIHWIKAFSLLPMPNFQNSTPRNAYEHDLEINTMRETCLVYARLQRKGFFLNFYGPEASDFSSSSSGSDSSNSQSPGTVCRGTDGT